MLLIVNMTIRSVDVTATIYVIQGYSDKEVGSVCMAIRGWTRDVIVTMSSRDTCTLTRR